MADDAFYLSPNFLEATRPLSLGAIGVLMDVIMLAVASKNAVISLDVDVLRARYERKADRAKMPKYFKELLSKGFLREVSPGRFLVAPGLWAFEDDLDNSAGGPTPT